MTTRAFCHDCDREYGDEHGFPDLVLPHDVWKKLAPRSGGGGLLCPSCICKRAHDAGLSNVAARFTSGPFCTDSLDRAWKHLASVRLLVFEMSHGGDVLEELLRELDAARHIVGDAS